jgi:cytochrome c2
MNTVRSLLVLMLSMAAAAGCTRPRASGDMAVSLPGDPSRGAELIARADCGVCHRIPGVLRARGRIAPPLTSFAERAWIAGEVPNTPETLVHWIQDPPSIVPNTAMPVLGISEADARDMAAYLYTLH